MKDSSDPEIQRAEARLGRVLRDKWRLDRLLGVGGMAAVYEATHRNGKRAAIKMLHPYLNREVDLRERFLREGYAANAVRHPGAVSVLDDDVDDDGTVFLVMELLEGESLDELWERNGKKLSPGEVLRIADELLDVLAAAHEKGIVHRDLKPDNVFRTRAGEIKILDFGIARLRDTPAGAAATRMGSLLGTPGYMAPEQARGRNDEVDARSDLWAVGATMFTLLSGRAVHVASTMNELLLAAMTTGAPTLGSVAPDVPAVVAEVVDRALSYERNDRYTDAHAMQAAVRSAGAALSADLPAPSARRSDAPLPLTRPRPRPSVAPEDDVPSVPRSARGVASPPRSRAVAILVGLLALAAGAAVPFVLPLLRAPATSPHPTAAPLRSARAEVLATPSALPIASASVASPPPAGAPPEVSPAPSASASASPRVAGPATSQPPKRPSEPPRPKPPPPIPVQNGRELEFTVPATPD